MINNSFFFIIIPTFSQSIIGKVKSRVSSILPNRLSKWFSPSTKSRNDELNGSLTSVNKARRRRRIEVDDEDADDDSNNYGEEQNHNIRSSKQSDEHSEAEDDDEEDEDDESQNSEEEYNATITAQKARHDILGRQPPAKRTRLNVDVCC